MPFEVYPIEGVATGGLKADPNRTPDATALKIQAKYEDVISRGGKIIAGHVMATRVSPTFGRSDEGRETKDRSYTGDNVLFLVAEFPEPTE